MADRPEMFGPSTGFSGMAHSMESCKMLWADPCCHGNEIWQNLGYFFAKSPISRLVYHVDQRHLSLPGVPTRGATLVAMATTFGPDAEI